MPRKRIFLSIGPRWGMWRVFSCRDYTRVGSTFGSFMDQEVIKILRNVVLKRKPQTTFSVSVWSWLHSDTHIWFRFFLDPEDMSKLFTGAIWNIADGTGLLKSSTEHGAERAVLRRRCIGTGRAQTQVIFHSKGHGSDKCCRL
jgi:hypothetical protein